MRTIRRHKRIAIFAVLAVFVMAGLAGAYWTQGGGGTGSAPTGTTAPVIVHQTNVVPNLYPGGPAQPLQGNFDNPNAGPVFVTGVTAVVDPTFNAPGGTKPACTAADFTIAGTSTVPGQIAPGTGVGAWSGLTIQMINRTDTVPGDGTGNQDNCKNVVVPILYTAN